MPNVVTAVRTVASVAIGLAGVASERPLLLLVAYAVYWIGDIADGWLARRLGQETRLGAVFDIISDRACAAVLCVGVVAHTPQITLVVGVFLLTFLVLDAMLSLAFLCWPIDTPNHFWRVDRTVYRLNWSPLAKAANTAGVVGAIALGAPDLGLVIASPCSRSRSGRRPECCACSARERPRNARLPRRRARSGTWVRHCCRWSTPRRTSCWCPLDIRALVLLGLTVLGVALGQTAGKVLLFETGRRARRPAWLGGARSTGSRIRDGLDSATCCVGPAPAYRSSSPPPASASHHSPSSACWPARRGSTAAPLPPSASPGRLVRFAVLATPLALA